MAERNQCLPSSFDALFKRMIANWPIGDSGIRAEKAQMFRELYEEFGESRFSSAVGFSIRMHGTGFFPTVAEFTQYIPEKKLGNPGSEHTDEEWEKIRAEQSTPEFQEAWNALMHRAGIKPAPSPQEVGKVIEMRRDRDGR